jgi:transcription elongation factor Elf1
MIAVLERRPFRCSLCRRAQFMITFGAGHRPVATCQECGQSCELWTSGAVPVRLINDDGTYAESAGVAS